MLSLLKKLYQTIIEYYPIVILLSAMLAFTHLTNEVIESETLALDTNINQYLVTYRNSSLTTIMINISQYGENLALVLIAFLILFLVIKKDFYQTSVVALTVGLALSFTIIFKQIIQRSRPDIAFRLVSEATFSYPSGHSTIAFTIYPIISIWLWRNDKLGNNMKKCLISFLFILTLSIAFSRLYLGVHYFSDIVAGAVVGLSMTWTFYYLTKN
jgi:undecaprenyl-diphosphatase